MVVIGLIAGPAMAASYIVDNTATGISWEATTLNGFTTNADDERFIRYYPDVSLGLSLNETITFTLANGTFQNNVFYVLCGTPIDGTAPADVKIGDQIAGGYGASYITFRFNASTIRGGSNNYIDISKDGETCGLGTYNNLAIKSNAGLAPGAKVSVAVSDARTVGNAQIITALTTGTDVGDLLLVRPQYAVAYSRDGTTADPRMISIADALKLFVEYPYNESDSYFTFTNNYNSQDGTWVPTNAYYGNFHGSYIWQDDSASATFTLTGAPSAVYAVYYDGSSCSKIGSNWVCNIPSTSVYNILSEYAKGNYTDRYINVYVDENTPIDNAVLNATLAVNFVTPAYLDQTFSFTNAVWQRQGTTLHVQFIKSSLPNYETYIKLQTKSVIPSPPVLAAVLCGDGSVQTGTLGPIVAGTPLLITGVQLSAICTDNGRTVNGVAGFAATLTVNSMETDMFGYANTCYQGDVGCRRIPVKTQRGFSDIVQTGVVSE